MNVRGSLPLILNIGEVRDTNKRNALRFIHATFKLHIVNTNCPPKQSNHFNQISRIEDPNV